MSTHSQHWELPDHTRADNLVALMGNTWEVKCERKSELIPCYWRRNTFILNSFAAPQNDGFKDLSSQASKPQKKVKKEVL